MILDDGSFLLFESDITFSFSLGHSLSPPLYHDPSAYLCCICIALFLFAPLCLCVFQSYAAIRLIGKGLRDTDVQAEAWWLVVAKTQHSKVSCVPKEDGVQEELRARLDGAETYPKPGVATAVVADADVDGL